jgi:hypothetical protein
VDAAREQLAAQGCSVIVVAQAKPTTLALYTNRKMWHVPLVSDPEKAAYTAFGLERTGLLSFFTPWAMWRYLRGMMKGYLATMTYKGEDLLQLGGDFILTRERKVVFAYPSAGPTDRPSIVTLLEALQSAKPIAGEPAPDGPSVDSSALEP